MLTSSKPETGVLLPGNGLYLRYPRLDDYDAWSNLRGESREFLVPWEPSWPADDLTRAAFRRRVRRYQRDVRDDQSYPFFAFREEDGALLGACTLSNVRRGVQQSCSLGYWMGERFAGQGLMTEAVRALLPFVFETLRLHRLQAACLPNNEPSKRVLEKLGFEPEGLARRFLLIDGAWRDHLVFALLSDDPWQSEP